MNRRIPIRVTSEVGDTDITPPDLKQFNRIAIASHEEGERFTKVAIEDYDGRGSGRVYLNLYYRGPTPPTGKHDEAEIVEPIEVAQLDVLVDVLIAAREKAREEGILPRRTRAR